MPEAAFQVIAAAGREFFHARTAELRLALIARGLDVQELVYLGQISDDELRRTGLVIGRKVPVVTTIRVIYAGDESGDDVRAMLERALADLGETQVTVARRSRHTDRDWTDQRRKVKRWYLRLKDVPMVVQHEGREAGLDFIDAFFESCYHLKDWVKRSGHPKAVEVEQFINDHPEMRLCRQLCNASKHFELYGEGSMRTDAQEIFVNGVKQPPPAERWVVIDDDGREWEMFELAKSCMARWDRFFA